MELYVQNDDGNGEDATQENIGTLRLSRKQLLDALGGDGLLQLDDKSGGLERIDITVATAPEPRNASQVLDVSKGVTAVGHLEVSSGEVLEASAKGEYRVGGKLTTPSGSMAGRTDNLQEEPFKSGPHGAAVLLAGANGQVAKALVAPCSTLLMPTSGVVLLAVNDRAHRQNSGDLSVEVSARPATTAELKAGRAESTCSSSATAASSLSPEEWLAVADKAVNDMFKKEGSKIAAGIQSKSHPSGKAPKLESVRVAHEGDGLAVQIETSWRGGLVGGHYLTTVLWELNQRRHVKADVAADTAPTHIDQPHAAMLDDDSAGAVYPALIAIVPASR